MKGLFHVTGLKRRAKGCQGEDAVMAHGQAIHCFSYMTLSCLK